MLSFTFVRSDASCDALGSDFHWKNKCNECNHRVTKQSIQHPCSSHSLLPCEFASKQKHRTIFPCNLNGTFSLSLCMCYTQTKRLMSNNTTNNNTSICRNIGTASCSESNSIIHALQFSKSGLQFQYKANVPDRTWFSLCWMFASS